MKTAAEWFNESPTIVGHWCQITSETIRQIQLDAMKEGMQRAACVVSENWNGKSSNYCELIEQAAGKLTP